ncbi:MAG: hypothetical protein AAFW46_01535 [Pseudomonadota bacterium]
MSAFLLFPTSVAAIAVAAFVAFAAGQGPLFNQEYGTPQALSVTFFDEPEQPLERRL